jgi:eukaryotic-like serine/threonine-protein kinase
LLVAGAALAAVLLLGGGGHHGVLGGGGGSSGAVVHLRGLAGYDPQGDGTEHNELAALATDGNSAMSWTTERYNSQAFGGLKSGVGLMLDAGSAVKLASVTVSSPAGGFQAQIEAGSSPTGSFSIDSSSQTVSSTTTFTLAGQTAQYYVVWITELPPGGRAEISEVTAKS